MEYSLKTETEIRQRFQITIPDDIRRKAELRIGDTLLWQFDENREEIIVLPKPSSFAGKLWGLGKEMWEEGDSGDEHVRKERESW